MRLGEHDTSTEQDGAKPIDVQVLSYLYHEGFDMSSFKNDVAVIKLVRKVTFTRKSINSIKFEGLFIQKNYRTPKKSEKSKDFFEDLKYLIWEWKNFRIQCLNPFLFINPRTPKKKFSK